MKYLHLFNFCQKPHFNCVGYAMLNLRKNMEGKCRSQFKVSIPESFQNWGKPWINSIFFITGIKNLYGFRLKLWDVSGLYILCVPFCYSWSIFHSIMLCVSSVNFWLTGREIWYECYATGGGTPNPYLPCPTVCNNDLDYRMGATCMSVL